MKNKFTIEEIDNIILQEVRNILFEQDVPPLPDVYDPEPAEEEAPAEDPTPEEPTREQWNEDNVTEGTTRDGSEYVTDGVYTLFDDGTVYKGDEKIDPDDIGLIPEEYFTPQPAEEAEAGEQESEAGGEEESGEEEAPAPEAPAPAPEAPAPAPEAPAPEPEEPEYAKSWTEYAETGEQEAEIARLWTQLTAKGPLQEALEGYTNSFFSYAKFYKDEVAKQMKQGGKSYISPEEMVALLKSKLETPKTPEPKTPVVDKSKAQLKFASDRLKTAQINYNKLKAELDVIVARDKEILDRQIAIGTPRRLTKGRKEYNNLNRQRSETLAQIKAKKPEVDQAYKELMARQDAYETKSKELTEATYNRWQQLIKG